MSTAVLIDADKSRFAEAKELLNAARFTGIALTHRDLTLASHLALVELKWTGQHNAPSGTMMSEAIERAYSRHPNHFVSFFAPTLSAKAFVRACADAVLNRQLSSSIPLSNSVSDAIGALIHYEAEKTAKPSPLDSVTGMGSVTEDLQHETGPLDAKKIAVLFNLSLSKVADLTEGAITKQGLSDNPASPKAQAILRQLERIARLRALPQFKNSAEFQKWFRRPLPLFNNHTAEDLVFAGQAEVVANKVEEILTGDFGG